MFRNRTRRRANSDIPNTSLRFELGDEAVKKAEDRFLEKWRRLASEGYGIGIHEFYVRLLGTPLLGELVNEFDLVLNSDVCNGSNKASSTS
jgi:hypothetical protein